MTLWENIKQWHLDGTGDRLQDACERKTPIKIKRSDGTFSTGIILEVNIRCIVAWGPAVHEVTFTGGHYRLPSGVFSKLPLRVRVDLELLSRLLSARPGDITLHTLDLDLLLVDHASPTTQGVQARSPVCFVTQGLIRESMLWATGQRPDVEETSCKARGEGACEFKITVQK